MNTPRGNRKHIVLYGNRNAGKSSIMNSIIGQDISLVSDIKGTTTDVVSKAFELIPFGPVVFIDTGGLDDEGVLGELRIEKTKSTLNTADVAIYVIDIREVKNYKFDLELEFKKRDIPYITVINQIDTISKEELEEIKSHIEKEGKWKNTIYTSVKDNSTIGELKEMLIKILEETEEDKSLIGDIVPYDGSIILVVPIDGEAPKGRLILPQVQLIRDCLDHGIKSYVVRNTELKSALKDLKNIDLVVTDSQIFKEVENIIPEDMNLTSFSIIMARQKGDLNEFIQGIDNLKALKYKENPKILVMESCSHNTSHEDIGRVKIPRVVNKYLGKEVDYDFFMGNNFPKDLSKYDLVIHCGSCMLNRKTMLNRIRVCKEEKVPITNYGMVLAFGAGIVDRSVKVFI